MKEDINARLGRVLLMDKSANIEKLLPVLKSDLRDLLRAYGELKHDINVEIEKQDDGFSLVLVASFNRLVG